MKTLIGEFVISTGIYLSPSKIDFLLALCTKILKDLSFIDYVYCEESWSVLIKYVQIFTAHGMKGSHNLGFYVFLINIHVVLYEKAHLTWTIDMNRATEN